ncbi:hypothetical protein BHMPCIPO_02593 [Ensifer sesbaniae]|nr:hypothetical protein [Ensifer sesbaniae]
MDQQIGAPISRDQFDQTVARLVQLLKTKCLSAYGHFRVVRIKKDPVDRQRRPYPSVASASISEIGQRTMVSRSAARVMAV